MFKSKKKPGKFRPYSDIAHYLRFAAVPLAAVALVALIMLSDSRSEQGSETVYSAGESAAETAAADEKVAEGIVAGDAADDSEAADVVADDSKAVGEAADTEDAGGEAADDFKSGGEAADTEDAGDDAADDGKTNYDNIDISRYSLKQDEVPELSALVRTYCQAREEMDVELLARLYGISRLTDEEAAEMRQKLELVHASIRSYENITCYSIEGPEPDTYVMFPYFELNYREAEIDMPQLSWAYATKIDDGSYVMNQDVSSAVAEYIARIGEKEDVRALVARVEEARREAVESDEKLRSIYAAAESEVVVGKDQQSEQAAAVIDR